MWLVGVQRMPSSLIIHQPMLLQVYTSSQAQAAEPVIRACMFEERAASELPSSHMRCGVLAWQPRASHHLAPCPSNAQSRMFLQLFALVDATPASTITALAGEQDLGVASDSEGGAGARRHFLLWLLITRQIAASAPASHTIDNVLLQAPTVPSRQQPRRQPRRRQPHRGQSRRRRCQQACRLRCQQHGPWRRQQQQQPRQKQQQQLRALGRLPPTGTSRRWWSTSTTSWQA
jgi:hypothetical protein